MPTMESRTTTRSPSVAASQTIERSITASVTDAHVVADDGWADNAHATADRNRIAEPERRLRCGRRSPSARRPERPSPAPRAMRTRPARTSAVAERYSPVCRCRANMRRPSACRRTPRRKPAAPERRRGRNRRTRRPGCNPRSPVRRRRCRCSELRALGALRRLFLKLDDAPVAIVITTPVLIDLVGFDQADRRERAALFVKSDECSRLASVRSSQPTTTNVPVKNGCSGLIAPRCPSVWLRAGS